MPTCPELGPASQQDVIASDGALAPASGLSPSKLPTLELARGAVNREMMPALHKDSNMRSESNCRELPLLPTVI
jgi:hypothetical protein